MSRQCYVVWFPFISALNAGLQTNALLQSFLWERGSQLQPTAVSRVTQSTNPHQSLFGSNNCPNISRSSFLIKCLVHTKWCHSKSPTQLLSLPVAGFHQWKVLRSMKGESLQNRPFKKDCSVGLSVNVWSRDLALDNTDNNRPSHSSTYLRLNCFICAGLCFSYISTLVFYIYRPYVALPAFSTELIHWYPWNKHILDY